MRCAPVRKPSPEWVVPSPARWTCRRRCRSREVRGTRTGPRLNARIYFWATFRRMPTASAEGLDRMGGGVGKVSVGRVFRCLQVHTGPRRSPSACSEVSKKKHATGVRHAPLECPHRGGQEAHACSCSRRTRRRRCRCGAKAAAAAPCRGARADVRATLAAGESARHAPRDMQAYKVMVYLVMAYMVMAHMVMAHIVMAYTVMSYRCHNTSAYWLGELDRNPSEGRARVHRHVYTTITIWAITI